MVKVKICGITNLKDARICCVLGCDALGFVFYNKSPRYILPSKAREIILKIPAKIVKVGVFVNSSSERIRNIARLCKLDMLQLHGDESCQFCSWLRNYKIIKAFRVKNSSSVKNISRYNVFAYLFDAFVPVKIGGTGKSFNWRLIKDLKGSKKKIFLSGGLSTKNVKKAIETVRPDWVDVSSSVEIKPGKKDYRKVQGFVKAVKNS